MQDFERKFLDFMRSRYGQIGETLRETGKLEDDTTEKMKSAADEFKQSYLDSEDVETVETVAAEEGVPEASKSPAAEGGDASTQPGTDQDEPEQQDAVKEEAAK